MAEPTAASTHKAYLARKHFANLDGLRFICIAMVLWHHARPDVLDGITLFRRGFLGVDFFFVLSGFLITTLLLREAATFGSFSLRDFYLRRIIRIFPVYFFVVGVVSFQVIVINGKEEYAEYVPYYLLFLSNYLVGDIPTLSITWSLAVEEQFYVIWPLLLLVTPPRFLLPVTVGLIAINVLSAAEILGGGRHASVGLLEIPLVPSVFSAILVGSLLALLMHRAASFAVLARLLGGRAAAFAGFAALVMFLSLAPGRLEVWHDFVIWLLMAAILAALVIREDNAFLGVLRNRFVARIGVVSYGMYLYHLVALHFVNAGLNAAGLHGPWTVLLVYSVASYVIAEISFRTLEAYFRRFRPAPRRAREWSAAASRPEERPVGSPVRALSRRAAYALQPRRAKGTSRRD
jgi:peptidoglycan/LPS O-acetylase OafA/YrhL